MMTVTASVITGELEYEEDLLGGVWMYICPTMTVNATVTPKPLNNNWIYGRPIMFKKGRWSYG